MPDVETQVDVSADGTRTQTHRTQQGTLTATFRHGHPLKYPVATFGDLRVLRDIWENTHYQTAQGTDESYERVEAIIGDAGVFTQTLSPSPVQQLIEFDMGMENFYALLCDHRDEMAGLLDVMHARRCDEYRITAECSPVPTVIAVENTSSQLISPDYYRRYSLPQLRDFVDIMHESGKIAILHMCGHLKNLLPVIKETGLDGVHAMTPAPIGVAPWDLGFDILGDDTIIIGSLSLCLANPTLGNPVDIRERLDSLVTDRLRGAHLILNAGADGTPLPVGTFYAVRDWIEEKG